MALYDVLQLSEVSLAVGQFAGIQAYLPLACTTSSHSKPASNTIHALKQSAIIYVCGSSWVQDANTVESFDTETEIWTVLPSMYRARDAGAAIPVGNKLYLCGCVDSSGIHPSTIEIFLGGGPPRTPLPKILILLGRDQKMQFMGVDFPTSDFRKFPTCHLPSRHQLCA